MSFTLLTAAEDLPPPAVLARVLSAALGTDLTTAAQKGRHGWGILGSGLDEAMTERLEEACAAENLAVIRLEADSLPVLPPAQPVKKFFFGSGQAVFSGPAGFSITLPPGSVSVIAAAPVKEEFLKTTNTTEGPSVKEKAVRMGIMAVTGLPIGLGKSKEVKKEIRSSEMSFYLDLLTSDGLTRLRLFSGDLDFSGLKEKKTYSSQMNFRVLTAELAAFTPEAFKNAGLKAMLSGKPLGTLPYEGLADLEKETLRLALAKGIPLA